MQHKFYFVELIEVIDTNSKDIFIAYVLFYIFGCYAKFYGHLEHQVYIISFLLLWMMIPTVVIASKKQTTEKKSL